MQQIPGGATAKPFVTHHNALDMDLFLRIAPELYLKRLVVGGFDRVFEINRNFRNEGISMRHNPEFTMMEFYQAYATFEDLMDFTEELLCHVAQELLGTLDFSYGGARSASSAPGSASPCKEAILEYGEIDAKSLEDRDLAYAYAQKLGLELPEDIGYGRLITEIFEEVAETKLIQPTFITAYPTEVSPLSRKNDHDPEIVDRFEFFCAGREMANAFSELNDPRDQKERFLAQVAAKAKGDEEAHYMDEDYIRALEYGMPPTAGEGIGIDRLVMLLTDSPSIRDVILFPQLQERGASNALRALHRAALPEGEAQIDLHLADHPDLGGRRGAGGHGAHHRPGGDDRVRGGSEGQDPGHQRAHRGPERDRRRCDDYQSPPEEVQGDRRRGRRDPLHLQPGDALLREKRLRRGAARHRRARPTPR